MALPLIGSRLCSPIVSSGGISLLGCPLYSECGHHPFPGSLASQAPIRSSGSVLASRRSHPGYQRRQRCSVACTPFADRSRSCRWTCADPLAARSYDRVACWVHPLASAIAQHRRYVGSHHGRDRSLLLLQPRGPLLDHALSRLSRHPGRASLPVPGRSVDPGATESGHDGALHGGPLHDPRHRSRQSPVDLSACLRAGCPLPAASPCLPTSARSDAQGMACLSERLACAAHYQPVELACCL